MTDEEIGDIAAKYGVWIRSIMSPSAGTLPFARAIINLERERIVALLCGIDKTEDDGGWWTTSTGAEFGAEIRRKIEGKS